jgi:F-type H+-transporting ATPase subunit delta
MAELATIARPYAEALFKASSAKGTPALWAEQVNALAAVAADASLREFADSPKVSVEQVFEVITSVVSKPLADEVKNFLRTVLDNGRLVVLPEIARQFMARVNAASGVSDAVIYSAYALDDAALSDLLATLEKRFGRKLAPKVELEPALIGGVRVVVGDEVLDTSVKNRLERMKVALTA